MIDDSDRLHGGSLRSKLVLSLACMFLIFLSVDSLLRQRFLRPAFSTLEKNQAVENAGRVLSAIETEKHHLSVLASQFAHQWQNRPADQTKLTVSTRVAQEITAVHVVQPDGRSALVFHRDGTEAPPTPPHRPAGKLNQSSEWSQANPFTDIWRLPDGALALIAAAKIPSEEPASLDETIVVQRNIDALLVNKINGRTKVQFTLQTPQTGADGDHLRLWTADESTFVVEFPLRNVSTVPVANVFVQLPRHAMMRAYRATRTARSQFVYGSVAALLLLLLLLQRIVIGPLQSLRDRTNQIVEEGLHSEPAQKYSNDEIGKLGCAFENMVLRLRQTQIDMSKSSRAAGMSQVASTVVHNIGNVLTNVNSLLETIEAKVASLRVDPLGSLAKRLREPDVDDKLAEQAPEYLHGLSQSLCSDRDQLAEMLRVLQGNIAHIHDVIREQRQHTGAHAIRQTVVVDDLLQEAICCCHERMRQSDVQIRMTGDLDASIQTDPSVLLQVFINLIANAQNAFDDCETTDRELMISVKRLDDAVRIRFADNASGMSEDTLKHLFEAHYTTRSDGSGLGLHFCSLSVARLDGRIEAYSRGIGLGSELTIWLPVQPTSPIDPIDQHAFDHEHDVMAGTA